MEFVAVFFSHEFHELTWERHSRNQKKKADHVHVHVNVDVNVYVNVHVDVDVDVVVNGSCHPKILSRTARICGLVVRSSQAATKLPLRFFGLEYSLQAVLRSAG